MPNNTTTTIMQKTTPFKILKKINNVDIEESKSTHSLSKLTAQHRKIEMLIQNSCH